MTCKEVQNLLELYVLGGLDPVEAKVVQTHLEVCVKCRILESEYCSISENLFEAYSFGTGNSLLADKIMDKCEVPIRRESVKRAVFYNLRRFGKAISAAACIGIAFLSINYMGNLLNISREAYASVPNSVQPFFDTSGDWQSSDTSFFSVRDNLEIIGEDRLITVFRDKDSNVAACINTRNKTIEWESCDDCLGCFSTDGSNVFCVVCDSSGSPGLAALDLASGKFKWRHDTFENNHIQYSAPLVVDSEHLCWVFGGSIYMLNKDSGRLIWKKEIDGEHVLSKCGVYGERLIVSGNKSLYSADIESGEVSEILSYDCDTCSSSVPLLEIADSDCYVSLNLKDGSSRVMGLDCGSWQIRWDKQAPRVTQISKYKEQLLLRCQYVYSLNRRTGCPVWHYKAKGCSPVECFDEVLVFVDQNHEGRLVGLSPEGGGKLWELEGINSCSRFIKKGQKGFIKTSDGVVHVVSFG